MVTIIVSLSLKIVRIIAYFIESSTEYGVVTEISLDFYITAIEPKGSNCGNGYLILL